MTLILILYGMSTIPILAGPASRFALHCSGIGTNAPVGSGAQRSRHDDQRPTLGDDEENVVTAGALLDRLRSGPRNTRVAPCPRVLTNRLVKRRRSPKSRVIG
jgi:hypothetical protein